MAAAVEAEVSAAGTSKLSAEERVELGIALKEKGNEYFKKQEYRNAMKSYHKALLHVKGLVDQPTLPGIEAGDKDISDEVKNSIYQVQFGCYNNLAGKFKIFVINADNFLCFKEFLDENRGFQDQTIHLPFFIIPLIAVILKSFLACLLKDGRWDRTEHYCNEVGTQCFYFTLVL